MLSQIDTVLLDCDGVIWNGDDIIEGALETIEQLKRLGKRVLYVTNNASKSRQMYLTKFQKLGIDCTVVWHLMKDDIFGSAYAAAYYVSQLGLPSDKRVYVIGMDGLVQELESMNITWTGSFVTRAKPA